jgi:arylsulfatase A-like enzyme/Tfp pilus assembly protein PilF
VLLCFLAASVGLCGASLRPSLNGAQSSSAHAPPPSVVLITIDTVRADHLGCYGYRRIETPSIDQLASEGIRFEHAYAQVPLTLPSHTVIMTGTYPMFNGVRDLTSPGLTTTLPTLAEIFQKNGYRTAAFVSSFVLNSMWGLKRGFEVYDDETDQARGASSSPSLLERRGDRTMERALAWLDSHADRPFFLWVHLYDPHSPYRPPEPYFSRYAGHLYDGEIAFDDAQLALLFARLRQLKLYDGALIVLTSDHGESLGEHGEAEHGFFIYNATVHVPLIVKLPGASHGSRVVADPAGLVDLAPTIAELCRIPRRFTQSFQGHPLVGVQEHEGAPSAPAVYAESYYPRNTFGWHELRALITSQYKYINTTRAELYDLERDSDEMHDLAAGQSALAAALRDELQALEGRFTNTSLAQNPSPLDSETLEKLRSLGYVGYQAPAAGSDSRLSRADPKDKIQVLNQMLHAGDLRSQQRFAEANGILASLERSDPALYIIRFERGETLLDWGKMREATEEFRKAVTLNSTFDQAWVGLGRAEFALGKNKDAIEAFRLALRLNPRNYLARRSLSRAYWRENQPEQAELELSRVVSEHPDFAEARAEHGLALVKVKRYREAIAELRAASSQGYRDAIVYYYLGLSYSEIGDAALAIEAYQKAVETDPNYAAAYVRLALQYRQRGELSKARQYYQKICKLSAELCRAYSAQF